MSVFVIGDLHLSFAGTKPMDVFEGWQGYVQKIKENWNHCITQEDTVVLAGDISWAMNFEQLKPDFDFLHQLPGKKVILKGNHDYWWSTISKMNRFLEENHYDDLTFLHNNCILIKDFALCGTRGWLFDCTQAQDAKVMHRECGRLRASLQCAGEKEKIVFLHYPPLYPNAKSQEIIDILKEFQVKQCYYGHLHGMSTRYAIQGVVEGIDYRLISADYLNFCPIKI